MKKPIKPKKPCEPSKTLKRKVWTNYESTIGEVFNNLSDQAKKINPNIIINVMDILIEESGDYEYSSTEYSYIWEEPKPSNQYNEELEKYKEKLKIYKKKYDSFKEEFAKYVSYLDDQDKKKKKQLLKELKEEFENV